MHFFATVDICIDVERKGDDGDDRDPVVETRDPPTSSPTNSPTSSPTNSPTNTPSYSPTKSPTNSPTNTPSYSPTKSPTNSPTNTPTKSPTNSPTNAPTNAPTNTPTYSPTNTPSSRPVVTLSPTNAKKPKPPPGGQTCDDLVNLGYGYSEATGKNHPTGCFPHVSGLDFNKGRDDSVSVFVGGNFIGKNAAELEGNLVVMGNLHVMSAGHSNFGSVGAGTQVMPNNGNCIIVGGNIRADRNIQVFNQKSYMKCDIVYKGNANNPQGWKTNGHVTRDSCYDMSEYEKMKYVLEKKSKFWGTLPSTGTITEKWSTTHITCSNNDDIQVFNVHPSDFNVFHKATSYKFNKACKGKTILINVHGSGNININAAAMRDFDDRQGYNAGGFSTCLTESILWNFPDATNVNIGNGWTSEFHGSLLVTGNMKLTTSGHSGRTMVLGDLTQDRGGSEFHSYQFNPPKPLPDPAGICELPAEITNSKSGNCEEPVGHAMEAPPTAAPKKPTAAPKKPTAAPKKPTAAPKKPTSAPKNCTKKWGACLGKENSCCSGLKCTGNRWWKSCK